MDAVTEHRPASQRNFANLMTFNAISGNGKCTLAVVATAARFSLLHLRHGDMRISLVRFKKSVMTIRAGEHAEMLAMHEGHRPEIRNGNRYGINRVTA